MNSIITFANNVIDVCVKCRHRKQCEWFKGASQVILDDVDPDRYCQMSQEQIATRIHADVPEPPEDCGQYSFDGMMEYLDEHLRTAQMPRNAEELLDLHYKICQLWRRLNRIPRDCREPFDAPIKAIINRIIAAVDYHFLMLRLDIIDILQDAHHGYDRIRCLNRDRVESVITVLLSRAHKITAEDIVAYKGDFEDYLAQNPRSDLPVAKADLPKAPFPESLQNAVPYLDVLRKHGILDQNYRWAKKEGLNNYHASWASKIMVHNCPDVTHGAIGQLIGITSLSSYVSLAKTKEPVRRLIEKLFVDEGLTVITD